MRAKYLKEDQDWNGKIPTQYLKIDDNTVYCYYTNKQYNNARLNYYVSTISY